ncbi:hypothetical protein [Desmospora activa]|uniref:Stage II sporulation protein B n=1 Tax=Desmospora activa DSM 45169 TaxID=1121389 RepID=A0A2T4Z8Q1_9BACL|nr:hypothetical protein [Desmospora activa]PTM58258.1 hypothetical protein C8J48_0838 [Desmospora activa DSM 45169]
MEKKRITIRFHQGGRSPTVQIGDQQADTVSREVKGEEVTGAKKKLDADKLAVPTTLEDKNPPDESDAPWVWGMEREESVEWGKPYSYKGLPDKKTVRSVILSIVGAVLLGTLMGFLVLSLFFSSESDISTRSIDSHLPTTPNEAEPSQQKTAEKEEQKTATLKLPALSGIMVQGGTYQEKAGGEQAVHQLRSEGWAAVMSADSPHRLLLGIGTEKDDAAALASFYKENGQTVILKEHQVKETTLSLSEKNKEVMEESIAPVVKEGHRIYALVAKRTSQGLAGGERSLQPVWKDVEQSSKKVSSLAKGMENDLPQKARDPFIQMMQSLDQVVQSGQANVNSPEESMLWQIQEGLIRYALAYEKFVAAVR